MMRTNNKITRFSYAGSAAKRKQKRDVDLDRMERNSELPVIFLKGFGFRPQLNLHDKIHIDGPLCPGSLSKDKQCLAELSADGVDINNRNVHCDVCGRAYEMPHSFQEFRQIAHKAYDGFVNSQAEMITLDVPYNAIKAEAEDETRKIRIKWSQKDGRNQAVIYFIKKDDQGGEKAHAFVDFDREEIRHDSGDKHPEEYLAKITAEFKNTDIEIKYGKQNKAQ
ncbi:TPA: hypothetical protein DIC62_03410 [Candidatus Nomurabacteria bacterium]|nr:hypothetical protein [Candidatus Nomurabacteria bacterium]